MLSKQKNAEKIKNKASRKENKKQERAAALKLLPREIKHESVNNMHPSPTVPTSNELRGKYGAVDTCEHIKSVLLSYTNPGTYPVVRVANGFTASKTAATSLYDTGRAAFGNFSGGGNIDTAMFVFRDQCRAFVHLVQNILPFAYESGTFSLRTTGVPLPLQVPVLRTSTGFDEGPHGPIIFPGVLVGSVRSYFWAESNKTFTFANNTGASLVVAVYRFADGIIHPLGPLPTITSGTSGSFTPTIYGYYGFDVNNTGTSSVTGAFSVTYSSPGGANDLTWAHRSLPFPNNLDSVDAAKIYACSLLYRNSSAVLNLEGDIVGDQIPMGTDWWDFNTYDKLSRRKQAERFNAKTGIFGYLKPTQPKDCDFINQNRSEDNGLTDSFYYIVPQSDYLAFAARIPDAAGQANEITASFALEYRTTDQWRDVEYPNIPTPHFNLALDLLARMPQFTENPFHLSSIGDWIKNAASDVYDWLKDTLPTVVKAGTTAASIAGAIIPLL